MWHKDHEWHINASDVFVTTSHVVFYSGKHRTFTNVDDYGTTLTEETFVQLQLYIHFVFFITNDLEY